ncbi:MAG: hypothetical protein ACOH2V_13575 [Candidatus Saccharimonadaceae bacterium]
MIQKKINKITLHLIVFGLLNLSLFNSAWAIPSFARQTGLKCNECHTVFPELTPFGRLFKFGGYVLSKSGKSYESFPPLAAMAQVSYSGQKGLTPGIAPFDKADRATDKINLPQQLSLFYGGRIYKNVGAFVQATYDGVDNKIYLDMTDIRYSNNTILAGRNLIYGLTINNSPTVQDGWNSVPAWGYPYASSSTALSPAASPIIHGGLDQQVGGIGANVFWNNLIYLGGTVYRTTLNGITKPLGAGTPTEMVVNGAAPYWRLALERRWKNHFFTVGSYGMLADIYPSGLNDGPTNRFTDYAFDAQYQYMGTIEPQDIKGLPKKDAGKKAKKSKHIITAHAVWTHEKQDWMASFPLGNTANPFDVLNTFRINLNYYYRSHLGDIAGSASFFSTTGDKDMLLYAAIPREGSRTGSPDSNGCILEADYRPWEKIKISLQYVIYNKFNGAHLNYDGADRNASANNACYMVIWFML